MLCGIFLKGKCRSASLLGELCKNRLVGRGYPPDLARKLLHLFNQAKHRQAIFVRKFTQRPPGVPAQYPAQREDPFRPAGSDKDLRRGLIEAPENRIQRIELRYHHQLRPRPRNPHVQTRQCGQHSPVGP